MNKVELISKVAEQTDFTKKDTGIVVDAVMTVITEAVASGDKVAVVLNDEFERHGI